MAPIPDTKGVMEKLSQVLLCPECNEDPPNLIEEFSSGDIVCDSCGRVLGDRIIDTRSEWRTFANDDQNGDDPSRVGDAGNPLLDGAVLETSIARGEGKLARDLHRAQNKQSAMDKNAVALQKAWREIKTYCDQMALQSNICEIAKHIWKLSDEHKVLKGKSPESVVAGCIFMACRQENVGRTFKEVYQATRVNKKEIGKVYKLLERFLASMKEKGQGLDASIYGAADFKATQSTNAEDLVGRFCSHLAFRSAKIERVAKTLAQNKDMIDDLTGRSPLSCAASCIYFAAHLMGEPKTTKEVAAVVGVSDGTIKNAYKFMFARKDDLVEETWLDWGGDKSRLPAN